MKESRLFRIVYYLLDKGHTTAPELARELEVSVRTIYRDIDALSGEGIPIYAESGRNGGIAFLDSFVLDKALLSESEKKLVLSSLQCLSTINNINEKEVLTKLSALFNIQFEKWFEVDFSRWGNGKSDNTKFDVLKDAVINHKIVNIVYVNSYGIKSKREIYPLKFQYKSKAWYITAYCTERKEFRTFKINRIVEYEITDKQYNLVFIPEQCDDAAKNYNKIVLQFPKEVAHRVYDEFDTSQIEEKEENLIVTAEMPEDSWLIGYILSFATQVKVIEPAYLRNVLAKEAKKIYEMNK